MGGPEIERLVALMAKLPGMGPRSARRAALRMLLAPEKIMLPLADALHSAARSVRRCAICGNLDSRDPCTICSDPARDRSVICVVDGVGDVWALERASVHRGLYHVLGGTLSALGGIGPDDLNIPPLLRRIEAGGITEIILALPATVDGAATSHWLADRLAVFECAITRMAHGIPIGGTLDILDEGTLAAALRARRPAES